MVDLALLQSVSYIAGALGVCVAAFYYVLTLRVQQANMKATLQTRETQLFQSIYSRFSTREILTDFNYIMTWQWTDYDDFMNKYGPKNPDAYISFWELANYFEGLGIYVKRGLIDVKMVDDFLSGPIRIFWEKLKPVILEHRKRESWDSYFEWVEYLYNEVNPISLSQHPELAK